MTGVRRRSSPQIPSFILRSHLAPQFTGNLHQFAHTALVQYFEGIGGQYFVLGALKLDAIEIALQKLALGVVPAVTKGHLGEVIGAEAKKLSIFGNFVGGNTGPGYFDHGAKFISNFDTGFFHHTFGYGLKLPAGKFEFVYVTDKGDHDLGQDLDALAIRN